MAAWLLPLVTGLKVRTLPIRYAAGALAAVLATVTFVVSAAGEGSVTSQPTISTVVGVSVGIAANCSANPADVLKGGWFYDPEHFSSTMIFSSDERCS